MPKLFTLLGMQAAQRALWYMPLLFHMEKVLGFSGMQIIMVVGTGSLSAMVAPFAAGWLADRFVPAHRLYVLCQLVGAAALIGAYFSSGFAFLLVLIFIENFCFGAGVTLSNAICFRQLGDPAKFGRLVLGGTLGWMLSSWAFSFYLDGAGDAGLRSGLLAGGVAQAFVALYAWLTLPDTPPESVGPAAVDWAHVQRLMRRPGLKVLLLVAMVCGFSYAFLHTFSQYRLTDAGMTEASVQRWMTLGQVCEICALLGLATMHRFLGLKWVVLIGLGAMWIRMVVMSLDVPLPLLVAVQGLHGIDFAFAAVSMNIAAEHLCTPETRARAQAVTMLCLWGVGRMAGFFVSGWAWEAFDGPNKWQLFFVIPLLALSLVALLFAKLFPANHRQTT